MANINLFDGTSNLHTGSVFLKALGELSNYQRVLVSPIPGKIDLPGYYFVKELVRFSYEPRRKQVNLNTFLQRFEMINPNRNPNSQNVILLEEDIFRPGLNWCFGESGNLNNQNYIVVSTARIENERELQDWMCHELGHMYGAARKGRSNTIEALGSHCTNDLCVMQQKVSVKEAREYTKMRELLNAPTYCPQCQNDLRR